MNNSPIGRQEAVLTMQPAAPPAVPAPVWSSLGPGLVSGAADDDPSGIATYAQAGAQYGPALLWLTLYSLPMMVAVQMLCARLGRITGKGLGANIRDHFGQRGLAVAVIALLIANTVNIAADLAAMGEALRSLVGADAHGTAIICGVAVLLAQVVLPYKRLVSMFKWLTLVLFAYALVLFFVHIPWQDYLKHLSVPTWRPDVPFIQMVVAVLGTTISPYMFFWQASQEVEDLRESGGTPLLKDPSGTRAALRRIRIDTWTGMGFSNLIALCIMATGAAVFHAAGMTEIRTTAQAAEALRPVAGDYAFLLFAAGVIGTGMLAIPVLAGSAAYAVAEAFGWQSGLRLAAGQARGFYAVLTLATAGATLIDLTGLDTMKALIYAAELNGIAAVPILVLLLLLSNRRSVIGDLRPARWIYLTGWMTATVMGAVAIASLVGGVAG